MAWTKPSAYPAVESTEWPSNELALSRPPASAQRSSASPPRGTAWRRAARLERCLVGEPEGQGREQERRVLGAQSLEAAGLRLLVDRAHLAPGLPRKRPRERVHGGLRLGPRARISGRARRQRRRERDHAALLIESALACDDGLAVARSFAHRLPSPAHRAGLCRAGAARGGARGPHPFPGRHRPAGGGERSRRGRHPGVRAPLPGLAHRPAALRVGRSLVSRRAGAPRSRRARESARSRTSRRSRCWTPCAAPDPARPGSRSGSLRRPPPSSASRASSATATSPSWPTST